MQQQRLKRVLGGGFVPCIAESRSWNDGISAHIALPGWKLQRVRVNHSEVEPLSRLIPEGLR